jgi:hypothetical protein
MAEPEDARYLDASLTAQDINSTAEGEQLVVEPRERSEQEREWLRSTPAGRELI